MKTPVDAAVLPCLISVHVNVDWPRFIFAMFVLAGLMAYMVYSWLSR